MDVAIAVKLIDFASLPNIETLTLFAGDRDFLDAIKYSQEVLMKKVQIVAFKGNVSTRLAQWANAEVLLLNSVWDQMCSGSTSVAPPQPPSKKEGFTGGKDKKLDKMVTNMKVEPVKKKWDSVGTED